jgi:hypothetical protein
MGDYSLRRPGMGIENNDTWQKCTLFGNY